MKETKKKGKPTVTQVTIVITVLIIAMVGYYCYLVNREPVQREEVTLTFVQNVLLRNLEKDYPPSPKEVIKYYNDIMKCYYNEECTEDEITDLAIKARELYDEELLANNELGTYLIRIKADVKDFREKKQKITGFSVSPSTDVDYFKTDGYQFAKLIGGYHIMQGKEVVATNQVYLLRKDEEGHWKIYGWKLAEE